jgi:hypothetical protein
MRLAGQVKMAKTMTKRRVTLRGLGCGEVPRRREMLGLAAQQIRRQFLMYRSGTCHTMTVKMKMKMK